MKAIRIERYGPPESLVERELPSPSPRPDEIKVLVEAAGINFADLLQRLHLYGNAPRLPYIPGFEVAGCVVECGDQVTQFKPGDRVAGLTKFGGYADEVCIDEEAALPIPESMNFEEAAAVPVNYLTAWFCIFEMGGLKPNEKVLIQGGSGGVGIALIQCAIWKGAEILATAGSREKIDFLKQLGVHHAVNYRESDFFEEAVQIWGEKNVDLVIDSIGGKALKQGYQLLAPLGRIVSYGLSSAVAGKKKNWIHALRALWNTPSFKPLDLIQRNTGVYGFHLGLLDSKRSAVKQAFQQILRLFEEGHLKPIIAKRFPLSGKGAAAAHTYMHERRNIGKIVLVRRER